MSLYAQSSMHIIPFNVKLELTVFLLSVRVECLMLWVSNVCVLS